MIKILIGLILMSVGSLSSASSKEVRPPIYQIGERQAYITILSYNIKGLPEFAGVEHDRFGDIGLELAQMRKSNTQPSIILLQEAFVKCTRDLRDGAGYSHNIPGPGVAGRDEKGRFVAKPLNAGLWVLTDFPVTNSANVVYDRRMCTSWDCFANKGAQAVRVKIPGLPFELSIANTHMQAGPADDIRISQFDVLWRFVNKFVPQEEPLFVIGDVNTWPARPSYGHWMSTTKMFSVGDACIDGSLKCNVVLRQNRTIEYSPDQHFFRSGKVNGYNVTITPVYAEHIFHEPIKGRLLSDHHGYNVTYKIQWAEVHDALATSY